ncbi:MULTISPECIES: type I-E CRISPR-associated protein Cse1/CasA [Mycolicibacter]|uniref:Type I-E CRISPR-associated protein Cse1/CasA n=2 Tax=Mycolicibacter TaxID=1073531 RepID=A0ABU5XM96_9MYCO|nr:MULTISPECIES: type I-E CRISPR-associated protein Cse1/CasA [unclassified Mycolicibacter]MEB3023400.1 type I-E CRISPR-associated protein Cse1/CasA [Mycolicibacter sp. MYC098]MEB3033742.1 type I-E CRISPR-associated protein Cse1/CasA [Mycolicibacter sp. MYC340]
MRFALTADPWIPVLTDTGMATRNLIDAFAADVITVACGDDLEDTAITRLMLAVQIAANQAGSEPADWLDAHRDRFDIFDPERPFWQNADMARFDEQPGAIRPIITASYRHVGNKSVAVNLWHTASGVTYSPAAAARLLVVRQQFSVGGLQSSYGKIPRSAKTAIAVNRPLLWLDTGRLAESMRCTAALTADRPAGTFWFTWPNDHKPTDTGEPTGILDALTWPARSILLRDTSTDVVAGIMICEGVRWPEPASGADQHDLALIPHTVYARKKASDPYTAQGVHPSRLIWRQLATMCADPDNPAAPWQATAAELNARWRLGGLGSYQSAIFGPLTGSFPAPRDPATLATFLADLTEAYQRIGSAAGSLAGAISGADGYTPAIPSHTSLAARAEPLAEQLATGQIDLEHTQKALGVITDELLARAYGAVARVRPRAAGRTAARKTNATSRATKSPKQ